MQDVITKIENNVEFMIFNGDKKWFLYELSMALNEAIYEFSAYLTGDPSTQLQSTLNKSQIQNSSISQLEKSINMMRVTDLQPSDLMKQLHGDYLEKQNKPLCNKMMEIVQFKDDFNFKIRDIFRKKSMMRENSKKIYAMMNDTTTYNIHNRKDDIRRFNRIEKDLTKYKKLENLYYKDVSEFEKILGEGHQSTNEGLTEIQKVMKFDGKNSLRILGNEYKKMRVGLSRLIRKLLKVRESIKSDNYSLNKLNKFEKVQEIYSQICGQDKVYQFDPNWPPFEKQIDEIEYGNVEQINRIHASFHHLIEAFDHYYSKEIDFSSQFFTTLDRLAGVDTKMLKALDRFNSSQYRSDHEILDTLLKNMADVRNNLRKVTAKCFGPESSNCQEMRQVLQSSNDYRSYAYSQLKVQKKKLAGLGNEHQTQEFWKKMSFRLYDYINRVFVKTSNINVEFLDRYDNSIGYTIGKFGKIVEKLSQSEKLCNNPQIVTEDQRFNQKIVEQKKLNSDLFKSIVVDERPLVVSEDLKEAGKHRFTFPELNKSVVIRNLKEIQRPTDVMSGSPPSPNEALKNMIKFTDESKGNLQDNKELVRELRNRFHFNDPNAPLEWKYEKVNSSFAAGKTCQDYLNLIFVDRPIKYRGKTYPKFRTCHQNQQKEQLISETPWNPPLKTHEKGYGHSQQTCVADKPLPISLPMAKPLNRMNQNMDQYTLSPIHSVHVIKNQSDDIPSGSDMHVHVVVDIKESSKNGIKGTQIDYYQCQIWKSSPLLRSVVDAMASSQGKNITIQTCELIDEVIKTNPVIPRGAKTQEVTGIFHPEPFVMKNVYADEISENREFRGEINQMVENEIGHRTSTNDLEGFTRDGRQAHDQGLMPSIFGNTFKNINQDIDDIRMGGNNMEVFQENKGQLMILGGFLMILLKIWFS